ncbi:MAG: hypothetical protein HYS45_02505 [Parcubacteria group bacterium]|nr:hypothetical protein [Parcubacteria group bacterium]
MERTWYLASFFGALAVLATPRAAHAHCPLCTAGAVAIGLGAYQLGVSTLSVGIALGAASLALGLWMAKLVRVQYFRGQRPVIAFMVFATTVLPVAPFLPGARGLYLAGIGQYGTTLVVPLVFIGAAVGGLLVLAAPYASRGLTRMRGGAHIPFQGVLAVVVLLAAALALVEVTT